MGLGKKVFTRKNGTQKGGKLYKWSPLQSSKRGSKIEQKNKFYCSAVPRSQGEDWKVTYMLTITVIDGVQHKVAYVACDYVQ
mgnify:CR=1 FL=1